jgi:hypothetical protein
MKKFLILFSYILFLTLYSFGQHLIVLDKKNTFHSGNSYLVDVPLNGQMRYNLFIQDRHRLIPLSVYRNVYKNQYLNLYDTIFVSYNPTVGRPGLTRKILQKELVRYVLRWNQENPLDTLIDADDRFVNYRQLPATWRHPELKDSILVYYTELIGDGCCHPLPTKPQKVNLSDFIKKFEHKHHVSIGPAYAFTGDEGDGEM